jgi:RNA polymerase sigma-70 factor (ECF subfamily)
MDRMDGDLDMKTDGPQHRLSAEDFVTLVLRHEHRIRGFVASLMVASSDMDDVFQNACLAAFKKLETFGSSEEVPDEEFVRWVCTIARFEVLQVYRKLRKAKVVFSSELVTELADMQLQESDQLRDRAEALNECIHRLSDKERALVRMRYGEGKPVVDMATYFGRTANGVYKALERVRARLMACIRRKLRTEGLAL